MSKEFDTSWFDLTNYDKLSTLDLSDWYELIIVRASLIDDIEAYRRLLEEYDDYGRKEFIFSMIQSACLHIKTNPSIPFLEFGFGDSYNREYICTSVYSTCASAHFDIANDPKLSDISELLKPEYIFDNLSDEDSMIISKPIDMILMDRDVTHVTVQLEATDEQIMNDFRQWLNKYREITGRESIKKLFKQTDFNKWIKYGVLPYLDLKIIANIEGKKIKQVKMAHLIFPDEYDVGTEGRIRQVTKPEAEQLIKKDTLRAIQAQVWSKLG